MWTAAALLSVAAAVSITLAMTMPLRIAAGGNESSTSRRTGMSTTRAGDDTSASILASLEPALSLRLRQPLGQSTPTTNVAEAATPAAPMTSGSDLPPYTLVGTIGDSLALLRSSDGNVEVKAANESVGGMEILRIGAGESRARYNGRMITLQKPKDDSDTAIVK
jgi:hypothetical protein